MRQCINEEIFFASSPFHSGDPERLRMTLADSNFATRLMVTQRLSFPVGVYLFAVGAIGLSWALVEFT